MGAHQFLCQRLGRDSSRQRPSSSLYFCLQENEINSPPTFVVNRATSGPGVYSLKKNKTTSIVNGTGQICTEQLPCASHTDKGWKRNRKIPKIFQNTQREKEKEATENFIGNFWATTGGFCRLVLLWMLIGKKSRRSQPGSHGVRGEQDASKVNGIRGWKDIWTLHPWVQDIARWTLLLFEGLLNLGQTTAWFLDKMLLFVSLQDLLDSTSPLDSRLKQKVWRGHGMVVMSPSTTTLFQVLQKGPFSLAFLLHYPTTFPRPTAHRTY